MREYVGLIQFHLNVFGNKVSEPKHYIKLVVDFFANKRYVIVKI